MNFQQQYSPYGQYNKYYEEKAGEKSNLASISKACSCAVIGFIGVSVIISFIFSLFDKAVELYNKNDVFNCGYTIVISALSLGVAFYLAYISLKKKKLINEVPFGKPYNKREYLLIIPIAVMICFIGNIATNIFSGMFQTFFGVEFTQAEDTVTYTNLSGIIMSFIATALLPAFLEEFAIRGVVMQSLRRYGDMFAIVMSSFVFSLMHANMIQIPFAFIAGIGIGYAVIKTGTIWTGVIIHFINNSLAVISMVAMNNLPEKADWIFVIVMYTLIFAAGIICFTVYSKDKKQQNGNFRGGFDSLSRGYCTCLTTAEKITSFIFTVPTAVAVIIIILETSMYIN